MHCLYFWLLGEKMFSLSLSPWFGREFGLVGGGRNGLFSFLFICLASSFKIALTTHQILSCCFAKTMCKIVVFLSCLAKSQQCWLKTTSLSFFCFLWTAQGMAKACATFIPSFPRLQVHIYIHTSISST